MRSLLSYPTARVATHITVTAPKKVQINQTNVFLWLCSTTQPISNGHQHFYFGNNIGNLLRWSADGRTCVDASDGLL